MPDDEKKPEGEPGEGKQPEGAPQDGKPAVPQKDEFVRVPPGTKVFDGPVETSMFPNWIRDKGGKPPEGEQPAEGGEQPAESGADPSLTDRVAGEADAQPGVPGQPEPPVHPLDSASNLGEGGPANGRVHVVPAEGQVGAPDEAGRRGGSDSREFDLSAFRAIKTGTYKRFNLNKFIRPGQEVLDEVCTILGKDGSETEVAELGRGATGRVVKGKINKWKFLEKRMRTGEIENDFGITKDAVVYDMASLTPEQDAQVSQWIAGLKQTAQGMGLGEDELPPEVEAAHIPEKLRDSDYIVAIKFFDPVAAAQLGDLGKDERKRFGREGLLLQHEVNEPQKHPNLVEVFDYGEKIDPETMHLPPEKRILHYKAIVEEFVEVNLQDYNGDSIKFDFDPLSRINPSIDYEASVRICDKVQQALRHAHRNGIVVRDVSIKNILLRTTVASREGKGGKREFYHTPEVVRLADLGIAKAISKEGRIVKSASEKKATSQDVSVNTGTGMFAGTPFYVSPEQARDAKSVGPESDTFSLGVVLYELTARRRIVQLPEGADPFDAQDIIKSTHPKDNFKFANRQIEERIELIVNNARVKAEAEAEEKGIPFDPKKVKVEPGPLPELISDELEDLIMLMLEKNRTKRIREEDVEVMLNDIIKRGIYTKKKLSPEEEAQLEIKGKAALKMADDLAGTLKEGDIDNYWDAARLYKKAALATPRMLSDRTAPERTRESIFANAIEFYRFVAANMDKLHTEVGREFINAEIHLFEARERLEQRRIDQYVLMGREEKRKEEALWKEIHDNLDWKQYEGAEGWGAKAKRFTHRKQKAAWEAASTNWLDAVIASAEGFRSTRKFNAARSKLGQARAFLEAKTDEDKIENKMEAAQDYLSNIGSIEAGITAEEEDCKRGEKIVGMIEGIDSLIRVKEFDSAKTNILTCYEDVGRLADLRYKGWFEERLSKLRELNHTAQKQYEALEAVNNALEAARREYNQYDSLFKEGRFFDWGDVSAIAENLDRAKRKLGTVDASLAGEDDYEKIKTGIAELRTECEGLCKRLSDATYTDAVQKTGRLEEIAGVFDGDKLAVKGGAELVKEATETIADLDGATGMTNIPPQYVDEKLIVFLRARYEKVKGRITGASDEVLRFASMKGAAETSDDVNEKTRAAVALAAKYVRERGDIISAADYFGMIPPEVFSGEAPAEGEKAITIGPAVKEKAIDLKRLFDTYEKVKHSSKFVKRTREGLDESKIRKLLQTRKEYNLKLPKGDARRNDAVFDGAVLEICKYVEPGIPKVAGGHDMLAYPMHEELVRQRTLIDKLWEEERAIQAEYDAMPGLVAKEGDAKAHPDSVEYTVGREGGKHERYAVSEKAKTAKLEARTRLSEAKEERSSALYHWQEFFAQLVSAAKDKLANEGVDQPEDREAYKEMAQALLPYNPEMAVDYYGRYSRILPEEATEREVIRNIVRDIKRAANI